MAKIRFDYIPSSQKWPAGDKFKIKFTYESHNQAAYSRLVDAIAKALQDPPPEPTEKASRIGFSMDHDA